MVDMWMVRAGKKSILIDDFEELNVVAIGWGLGDLTNKTPDEIKELVNIHYPNNSNQTNGKIAANEIKFRHEIKKGDYVLSYNSWTQQYFFGKISSDYYYSDLISKEFNNDDYSDVRDVEWLSKIPKKILKKSTQNTLKTQIAVFNIDDDAKEDILNVFNGSDDSMEKSASIIRKYLDENEVDLTQDESIFDKFKELFGPDVLEKLEGADIINRIFLHDSDNSTLCYNLEFADEFNRGGIGGGSAYKYSLFKSGKTHQWTSGSSRKQKVLTESEAIEVGSKIRDAIVNGARHIEKAKLESVSDYIQLENDLNNIFKDCIVKPTSSWIHKYYVLIFPHKFPEVHGQNMREYTLRKFRIEPENGYYANDGQYYQLAKKADVKLYSLFDDKIIGLFFEGGKWDPIEKGRLTDLKDCEIVSKPYENNLKRNVIYFGAPGTGKSYNLNKDKDKLLENYDENYERVTFHPDYSYANFVGTYKPVPEGKDITYKYVPGPFMRILKESLQNPDKPYLLIIEEINRANVAAVFGDVFQLLDRNNEYESEYDIATSEDMKSYINEDKIKLPSNLFIWATMNSADQGVFPMDTAFKRRWDFKYFSINHDENLIDDTHTILNDEVIYWNDLRKQINDELLSYKINEDKLMGPFFAFNEFMNQEIPEDIFKDTFKNKIIMYLFEDAARSRRNDLFTGARKNDENITYSRICEVFDEKGLEIFCDNIKNRFLDENE